uniref:helix-turn-helix transcriptional regulator n=1 Tax=Shimia sp. TaxID=1954381 RepID=UPI003562ADBE
MQNSLIDTLDQLARPGDLQSRWEAAVAASRALGIKSILVAHANGATREIAWVNTNMSDAWMDEYLHQGYVDVDPLVSNLAFQNGTQRLEAGTVARDAAPNRKALDYNHGLKDAGYGTLICSKFGGSRDFGTFVTLGFEPGATMDESSQLMDLSLFSAFLAAFITAPLPDRTNRALTGTSLHLSPRQRDVLCLLASGHQTARIAEKLGVTEATVTFHMARAREALGA